MPNFRDVISKSILILLLCLHAVNACRTKDLKNNFFSITTTIQGKLLHHNSPDAIGGPAVGWKFDHYNLKPYQLKSITRDIHSLLLHWLNLMATTNKELNAAEFDISRVRTELAQLKKLQWSKTILGVKNAKIRNIAEGTDNAITDVEKNLQTTRTTLGENTFTWEDLHNHEFYRMISRVEYRAVKGFFQADKKEIDLLVLEFNRMAKITERLEAKEMEISRMRRKLAQESGHLKKATEENLLTMTTTLKEQEEKSEKLKAFNTNLSQMLEEKNAKISQLKNDKVALEHFLQSETVQSQTKLEAKETHTSSMRTELAQRRNEIETMNTVLGVKDAKIRNITEMSEDLKKQKFALDKNLQTMDTVLGVKDSNLKHSKLAHEHFLKNLTTQSDMTLEAMKAEISRITSRLTEKEATIETMNQTLKERMTYVKTLAVVVVLMLLLFYVFVMPCLRSRLRKKKVRSGQACAALS